MSSWEKRIDPVDGVAYTWDEMFSEYIKKFTRKKITKYWEEVCLPEKRKVPKGKSGAAATGKANLPKEQVQKGPAKALVQIMARREKDWRIGPIVYQVFVDRFAPPADFEQKKALYPEVGTTHKWDELPQGGHLVAEVGYYSNELAFWGGDFASMLSKMDHLKELGVDVLYLQPITECTSNHKYDTKDYMKVDAQYGTLDDFKKVVDTLHGASIKLVLDVVFNHCGKSSPLVQEALADKDSPKRNWFFFGDQYKQGFKTWGGAPSLVELALENKDLQNYLWNSKDSVLATWLGRGADGCRLDVASEIGLDILAKLKRAAHRHKKDSLVIGEVWAYPPQWTQAMDAVLSLHLGVVIYGLAEGSCPGPTAAESIARMVADSSMEEVLRSWIVISNHDMPRLASRLPELRLRCFAQTLQFTMPGSPLVYYGDELGLEGKDDPHNRAPMPWEMAIDTNGTFKHTKALVAMRKRLRALRIGDYRSLLTQTLMAFLRTTDEVKDVVFVLANPSDKPVKEMVIIPVPAILGHTLFKDELSGDEVRLLGSTLTIEVQPKTVRVFAMVDESGNPSGDQYKRTYGHWASFRSVQP